MSSLYETSVLWNMMMNVYSLCRFKTEELIEFGPMHKVRLRRSEDELQEILLLSSWRIMKL